MAAAPPSTWRESSTKSTVNPSRTSLAGTAPPGVAPGTSTGRSSISPSSTTAPAPPSTRLAASPAWTASRPSTSRAGMGRLAAGGRRLAPLRDEPRRSTTAPGRPYGPSAPSTTRFPTTWTSSPGGPVRPGWRSRRGRSPPGRGSSASTMEPGRPSSPVAPAHTPRSTTSKSTSDPSSARAVATSLGRRSLSPSRPAAPWSLPPARRSTSPTATTRVGSTPRRSPFLPTAPRSP